MTEQQEIEASAKKFVDKVLHEFESGGAYIAHDGEVPVGIPGSPYERVDIVGWRQYVPPGTLGRWQTAVTRRAEEAGLINISGTTVAHDEASFIRPMGGAVRPMWRHPLMKGRKSARASCRCPPKTAKRKTRRKQT